MENRFCTVAYLAAILVLLGGCLDLNQDFTINADGTATYHTRLMVDANLAAMAELGDEETNDSSLCETAIGVKIPPGLTSDQDEFYEGGNLVCAMTVTGPIHDFTEMVVKGDAGSAAGNFLRVMELSDGAYRLSSDFSSPSKNDDDGNDAVESVVTTILAGRAFRWDVKVPNIRETNGIVSEDGQSIHWEIPLSDLISGGDHKFYVDFDAAQSWWDYIWSRLEWETE